MTFKIIGYFAIFLIREYLFSPDLSLLSNTSEPTILGIEMVSTSINRALKIKA